MDVAITPNEAYQGVTTHLELSEAAFMSNLAQVNKKNIFSDLAQDIFLRNTREILIK
jgi:hypothetical protein